MSGAHDNETVRPTEFDAALEAGDITEESPAPAFPDSPLENDPPQITPEGATPDRNALWSEPTSRKRRPLPRKALAAGAVAGLLLLLPFITRSRPRQEESTSTLPDDLVISERDLKNRREVAADDFRPRDSVASSESEAPAFAAEESGTSLADRRKQRSEDPEDLAAHRGKAGSDRSATTRDPDSVSGYERPYVYFERGAASSASGAPGAIAPAGSVVPAVLSSPVDLRAGTSTIIALADSDGAIPKSSRFVGSASGDGEGRLVLRFDRLLLPDGREARIQGEAQDPTGAFGVEGHVTSEGGSSNSTIAREFARDTAADTASEVVNAFTGGLGGRLLRRTIDRASTRRGLPGVATTRVSLPAGTRFQIFLHQAVVIRG
jgi:type IV secretory pathway VirB10-like protein